MAPAPGDGSESGYAPLATVERYHTEDKAYRDGHEKEHRALEGKIAVLEATDGRTDLRLSSGASAFSKIETQIEKQNNMIDALSKKILLPIWKIGAYAAGLVGLVVAFAVNIAKMPDRAEIEKTNAQIGDIQKQLIDVRVSEATRTVMQNDLKSKVDALDGKIDTLLRRP